MSSSDAVVTARLTVLRSYNVLDTGADPAFDDLTRLAAQICQTPIALIGLMDSERQWFISSFGLQLGSTSRDESFGAYALDSDEVVLVEDTHQDPRFADNVLVTGDAKIRFYAEAPLRDEGGHTLATLSVLDREPRTLSRSQLDQLAALGRQVLAQLTLRRQAEELATEVAAREASETALAQHHRSHDRSERRWRSLLENAPVGVIVLDASGDFQYANPRASSLYGGTISCPLIGRSALDFVLGTEDDPMNVLAGLLSGNTIVDSRRTLRQLDGNLVTVELNAGPVNFEGRPAVHLELRDMSAMARSETALRRSEARWRQLISGSPVGIGLADENGVFVTANPALCSMFGRPEADVVGRSVAELSHPDDLAAHHAAEDEINSAPAGVVRVEQRYLRPDGQTRWAWSTIAHTPGPEGQRWTIAHVQDVTERKADEQALLDSEANLSAMSRVVRQIQSGADARETIVQAAVELAGASQVTLLEPTPDGDALRASAASSPTLLGITVPLTAPSSIGNVFHTGEAQFLRHPPPMSSATHLALSRMQSAYIVPVYSGEKITAVLAVGWTRAIASLDDRRTQLIALLADQAGVALRQSALLTELESLALTDPLTSLPNRRDWDRRIAMLIKMAARSRGSLTVAIADLDHFKHFNDTYGHARGDALLREFGAAAQRMLRIGDTVARWGGEEFALVLPDCPAAEASTVLDRVRLAVPMGATCSIGHASWNGVETADELMARADKALYEAKSAGRNKILLAT